MLAYAVGETPNDSISGEATGLSDGAALCANNVTGQTTQVLFSNGSWDCSADGFAASAGELIEIFLIGPVL